MEGISDEVLEVARNLFNGGDIDYTVDRYGKATVDTDELPDLDTYEYAYGTTRAEILQQALDLIIKILPEVKFYNDYNNTGLHIELSDNHTLWNIEAPDGFNGDFDTELYNFFVEQAMEQFEQDTGVEIYQCGRSGRHICVSVDFDNILNYEDLRLKQAELEQQVIGEAESNCFGQADEINEGLKPDEKVAKCLSCGMKVKYRNRDVKHDAMGDYIECPNCKSTFDVDYDNTPTKKTEGYSLGDRYEVWQNYYEDGRTTTEYVMSFDNYAEAQRFASGLMQDPDCDAWVKDREEEESKEVKTEATLNKFQTMTTDKDGNEMLLKDVSYNNACSWLEKELAKAGSKVVDTETKGNKTIIKADNKTKFEYDEEKGTLKRLEEAEVKRNNSKKRLDYKLDGFKGVNIIVVDKKNNIDTEDYMKFDSMEFGIDEYEFEDSMKDGIKDILTDIYEYTDDYYDDRFTTDEITEMAEDITQDVLQLYDDLPDELIDFENGIANLGESKKVEAKDLYGEWIDLLDKIPANRLEDYKIEYDLYDEQLNGDEKPTEMILPKLIAGAREYINKNLAEAKINADALKISVAKKLADDMIKAIGNDATGMDKETYYKNTLVKLNDPKYIDSEIKNYECDNSNRSTTMVKDLNALKKALTEDVTTEQLPSSMLKDKIIKIAKSNGLTVDNTGKEWEIKDGDNVVLYITPRRVRHNQIDRLKLYTTEYKSDVANKFIDELKANNLLEQKGITLGESKKTEAEDMTQVKDAIETAVEKSDSTDLEKEQVKGSLDVLKTDEESAIEGYEDFKSETEKVADEELADAVNNQMEEIIDDEKEHIEKLDTIKSALSENKAERTADNMIKNEDKRSNDIYKYKGKEFRYDCDNAIVEYIWTDPDTNECVVIDEIGLSNDNWEDRKLRDAYLDEYIRQLDDEANRLADDFIANEFLGESLNQKINRKLQESREKFDRDELVAVKDSIDTALDDLQIQSDGTTGAMADKVLVNDLRSVSQSVGNYLNKVQEGKDLKHPELNNSVKAYYADAFGKDELNADIKEVTFLDLYRALKNKQDVYDLIGVRDNVVRERLFAELARILNQPTAYVNNIWQYGVEDGQPNIVKEDKETGTIKQSLNTGVLPIVNVDLYSLYSSGWFDNLVLDDDSNAKFDEIIQDIAPRFIKETLQDILPSVEIYATGVYHPREYNYGGDELEFDLVVNTDEYNALKEKALSSDMFETYLKDNYSSRSGFISSMPEDIDEFNNADEWKQMVQVIMFALKDTALTNVNEAYLNDFSEAVNQEFPYVDVEIDNAIEELEYKASKENITLDVDYVTNYIKEQFGNTDSYDYILDKVLSGLNLTESAKVDEAKKEELFNTDVNVNVDAGDIASGNNLDLGGLGEIASAVGLMASEENTKSDKEKLAEDSDDEIPVVNPDEQDYYDNKGYIISLYPRSRSNVNII